MKSPIQRRVAIASLLMAPLLGACGFSAQTDQVYQAAVGPDNRDSSVDVLNAVIVSNGAGSGTFAGSLVNNTGDADSIENITADGGTTVVPGGAIVVPAYGLVNLSLLGSNGKIPLVLEGAGVAAGKYVTLTFTFKKADPVTISAPVVDTTAEGEDYHQVPLPGGAVPTEGQGAAGTVEEGHTGEGDDSEHAAE